MAAVAAKKTLHWDILDKKRLRIIPELRFLKQAGFYLAGGTALALQIRHRISVDFDFYAPHEFDAEKIYRVFQAQKPDKLLLAAMSKNTLIFEYDSIGISLFTYDYPLLKDCIAGEYLDIASLEDIAAMKLIAIIQRGIKRDFIDLYFLSRIFNLETIMTLTKKKYTGFNKYLAAQALVYFKDAEESQTRKLEMIQPLLWKDVKKCFESEVMRLKKGWAGK